MEEKDYCAHCDLYTYQKVETNSEKQTEIWYCPVCEREKECKV